MNEVLYQRIKLILLVIFSSMVLYLNDGKILTFLMVILVILSNTGKLKCQLKGRIFSLFILMILIVLFQLIFNPLENVFLRLIKGITASMKIMVLSLAVFFYTASTSPSQILKVFNFLPRSFQLMLTITFSLIPVIFEEVRKIKLVQKTRGYDVEWWNLFRSLIPLIIPLLHRVLKRSEQIAMALYSRGYATD